MTKLPAAESKLERELTITRVINAPRELVFKAWTDAKHLAKWWGPKFFTNPICEIDAQPGGKLRIVMLGPGGMKCPMRGTFIEVVVPEKLVFTNIAEDMDGNDLIDGLTTVIFEDLGGKTKLTATTRATAVAHGVEAMLGGMEQGWTETIDCLQEYAQAVSQGRPYTADELDSTGQTIVSQPADNELVFTRLFNAPRKIVYKAWTDEKQIVNWWGPHGFTTRSISMDVRPGGVWRLVMRGPHGDEYKNRIVYLEVNEPERLVYKHDGEEGDEQAKFQITVTFEELAGKTKVTMTMVFASREDRDGVISKYGADKGGVQTLQRLSEYLEDMNTH